MARDKFITMRIDDKTRQALKDMAARDKRPLTNLLYLIITEAVEKDRKLRERGV